MDNPLSIIVYISISAIAAIMLLVFAPAVLIDYGFAIAWGWMATLSSWIAVEVLHADFEEASDE